MMNPGMPHAELLALLESRPENTHGAEVIVYWLARLSSQSEFTYISFCDTVPLVHVISQRALRNFASVHLDADAPLRAWYKAIKTSTFRNLVELKRTFGSVDYVPIGKRELYAFNIKGNKYRLVVSIHFNTQKLFVRFIMTHAEYDRGDWKK